MLWHRWCLHFRHWMVQVYPWFFTGYLLYDTYVMFLCDRHTGSLTHTSHKYDLNDAKVNGQCSHNAESAASQDRQCTSYEHPYQHNQHSSFLLEFFSFFKQNKMMVFHHLALPCVFLPVVAVSCLQRNWKSYNFNNARTVGLKLMYSLFLLIT